MALLKTFHVANDQIDFLWGTDRVIVKLNGTVTEEHNVPEQADSQTKTEKYLEHAKVRVLARSDNTKRILIGQKLSGGAELSHCREKLLNLMTYGKLVDLLHYHVVPGNIGYQLGYGITPGGKVSCNPIASTQDLNACLRQCDRLGTSHSFLEIVSNDEQKVHAMHVIGMNEGHPRSFPFKYTGGLDYLISLEVDVNKVYIVIGHSIEYANAASFSPHNIQLTEELKREITATATNSPLKHFMSKWGTHFISGFFTFSSFFSIIEVEVPLEEKKQFIHRIMPALVNSNTTKNVITREMIAFLNHFNCFSRAWISAPTRYTGISINSISQLAEFYEAFLSNTQKAPSESPFEQNLVVKCSPWVELSEINSSKTLLTAIDVLHKAKRTRYKEKVYNLRSQIANYEVLLPKPDSQSTLSKQQNLQFDPTRTYTISIGIEAQRSDSVNHEGWYLTTEIGLKSDIRDQESNYSIIRSNNSSIRWKLFSEDAGDTYFILTSNDKYLTVHSNYQTDIRDNESTYVHVQGEKASSTTWRLTKYRKGNSYVISVARDLVRYSNLSHEGNRLTFHRYCAKDKRSDLSTYLMVHKNEKHPRTFIIN